MKNTSLKSKDIATANENCHYKPKRSIFIICDADASIFDFGVAIEQLVVVDSGQMLSRHLFKTPMRNVIGSMN